MDDYYYYYYLHYLDCYYVEMTAMKAKLVMKRKHSESCVYNYYYYYYYDGLRKRFAAPDCAGSDNNGLVIDVVKAV